MTTSDDTLATEMIGLLREIRSQQDTAAQKSSALERAMLALNQGFAQLDDKRMGALTAALWGLVGSSIVGSIMIAVALAAIAWRL
jgi:hypothetical protein